MANIFQPKARHVLPAFRNFEDTVATGELGSMTLASVTKHPFDVAARVRDWQASRTVACAADLLSGQIVAGVSESSAVSDAAEFLLQQSDAVPPPLAALARRLLGRDSAVACGVQLPRLADFIEGNQRQALQKRIALNRSRANRWPKNPIPWVENSRLYSILGNRDRAVKNMAAALALAPTNRFVLRSAARLYAHYGEEERALHLLSRAPRTANDPWLASAELALAGMLGLEARYLKRSLRLTASADLSPASTAELKSGVGSVLLVNGDRRKGRRLFESALVEPNDNALAQIEWAFSIDRLFEFDVTAFDVERNHEALAREAFARSDWPAVLVHCEAWFIDMPFARGPVAMGAHVASVVLDDFAAAALFCKAGLVSHPQDPQLKNNLAYALALGGAPEEAARILAEVEGGDATGETTKISLQATAGLVAFRTGRLEHGRALYLEAIEAAARTSVPGLAQMAVLNYAREELAAGQSLDTALVSRLATLKIDRGLVTLSIFRDRVMAMVTRGAERPKARRERE